jgi:hypothetical protein
MSTPGADLGGGAPGARPPKIGKSHRIHVVHTTILHILCTLSYLTRIFRDKLACIQNTVMYTLHMLQLLGTVTHVSYLDLNFDRNTLILKRK